MEFDKSRIYSAVNADELKQGDKVIVAETLRQLKKWVGNHESVETIESILPEEDDKRFVVEEYTDAYHLAYLVERKENCTNCGARWVCPMGVPKDPKLTRCEAYEPLEPKTEKKCGNCIHRGDCITSPTGCDKFVQEAPQNYRPFKDVDELIKVFCEKTPKIYDKDDEKLFMPYIWVRNKSDRKVWLISEFDKRILDYLFANCEFLDGSPCGVKN